MSARTLLRSAASSDENGSSSSTTDGLEGQCAGQGDPLLLTAGQLVRVAPPHAGQPDQFEQLGDPAGPAGAGAGRSDVAGHGQVREQRASCGT